VRTRSSLKHCWLSRGMNNPRRRLHRIVLASHKQHYHQDRSCFCTLPRVDCQFDRRWGRVSKCKSRWRSTYRYSWKLFQGYYQRRQGLEVTEGSVWFGQAYFREFTDKLLSIGLEKSKTVPCLFIVRDTRKSTAAITEVVLYVDHCLAAGKEEVVRWIKEQNWSRSPQDSPRSCIQTNDRRSQKILWNFNHIVYKVDNSRFQEQQWKRGKNVPHSSFPWNKSIKIWRRQADCRIGLIQNSSWEATMANQEACCRLLQHRLSTHISYAGLEPSTCHRFPE